MRRVLPLSVRLLGAPGAKSRTWAPAWLSLARRRTRAGVSLIKDIFPWTPLGLLLTLFAAYGLQHFAYAELDLVWLVLGYAVLCLLALCPLVVLPASIAVRLIANRATRPTSGEQQPAERLVLETKHWRTIGYGLPRLSWVPLLQLSWSWREPTHVAVELETQGSRLIERVRAGERGVHPRIVRRIVVSDAFGLCRIGVRTIEHDPLTVLPALLGLSKIASFSSFAAGDELPHPHGLSEGDRLELRRYQPGDPLRFVHWKIMARSRQLMVRMPERALSLAKRVAAFLVAGPQDDATAAVARLALERGFLGDDFLFGTAEQPQGVSTSAAGVILVARSIDHRDHGERGLSQFMTIAERGGPTSFIVLVPPVAGPWLEPTLAACRGKRATILIGVDGLHTPERGERLKDLLFVHARHTGHPQSALSHIIAQFRGAGCSVAVYDRPAGRILSNSQIDRPTKGAAA